MKNKFNRLTSKEWLPFQKSWFYYDTEQKFLTENIRFFSKAEEDNSIVLYDGNSNELVQQICKENNIKYALSNKQDFERIQYAIIDLREIITNETNIDDYRKVKQGVISKVLSIYQKLEHRRFISIFIKNIQSDSHYYPLAWDLAKEISSILTIKDEKIACLREVSENIASSSFVPKKDVFYCLYFRKDENSCGEYTSSEIDFFKSNSQSASSIIFKNQIPFWFILKPQPRKKDEILHPAKYPEELVEMFINEFTRENDNVFDPMSGTGSTQIGAMKLKRNGYGTELSDFFAGIANNRCNQYINPSQKDLFALENRQMFKILNKDARMITNGDFPEIHYMLTSPPYWDMLNMKGAENQAKRIKLGLQTNYSEDEKDLGNVSDYNRFLEELSAIYFNIIKLMKPGSYLTIVVKNIKKKGKNYPLAWDLSAILQEKLILLPEVFWCQDDISIAPYGYGNTWVSNTFHQYCLNFQKPY
jgi:DNA modification methylase